MRFRKDVRSGDLVIKNKGGWMVPITIASEPIGKVTHVYGDGEVIPFGIVNSQASKDLITRELSQIEKATLAFQQVWEESKENAFMELFAGAFE